MAFALPADTNGSTGLPTQRRCRAQSRRRPWPGRRGAVARYHPRQPLRASQLSDCPFRAVTCSSRPDRRYRTCPGRPITEGCNTPGCCSPVAKTPLVGRGRRRRFPSLRNAHHVAPPPHHPRRTTTVSSGKPDSDASGHWTVSMRVTAPAAGSLLRIPKLRARVRFSSPAPCKSPRPSARGSFVVWHSSDVAHQIRTRRLLHSLLAGGSTWTSSPLATSR